MWSLEMTNAANRLKHENRNVVQVIMLVHGIRTHAAWTEKIKSVLEKIPNTQVVPVRYQYFSALRFLFPLFTRRAPIHRFIREYRDLKNKYKEAKISVLAHSFGTYVVTRAIEENSDIELYRLALCGGVVKDDFRFSTYRAQLGPDNVLNDCGTKDIWPVLAKSATWGYGATGTFGFGTNQVRDRFHELKHSDFFSKKFAEDFWFDYFKSGKIKGTAWDEVRPPPGRGLTLLNYFQPKYLLVLGLLWFLFGQLINPYNINSATVDEKLFVGHYTGLPRLIVPIHFVNPHFSSRQFIFVRAALRSPSGATTPVYFTRILGCQGGLVPQSLSVGLYPFGQARCDLEFQGDPTNMRTRFGRLLEKIIAEGGYSLMPPDYGRKVLTGEMLKNITTAAKENLIWQQGKWQFQIEFRANDLTGSQQSTLVDRIAFRLAESDVEQFSRVIAKYESGIGVLPLWLDFGESVAIQKFTLEIESDDT
jgi:intracellular sulfur oxidation DsrE/DsrF family protein